MLLELGPVPADDLDRWSRFARRVVVELRNNPDDLQGIATEDFLRQWSALIDEWTVACSATAGPDFRWSCSLDDEVALFLLHGLERCFFSPCVNALVPEQDRPVQRQVTLHIIQAFVDGLDAGGDCAQCHYAEQVRASLAGLLN